MGTSRAERGRSAAIRYANCWEDAEVLSRGLAPLAGARCLSIASAGDNALSLLARGAASVVAVDRSPGQLALLELKMAAFRSLAHPDLLAFLGARPGARRLALYAALRPALGAAARDFWDLRPRVLAEGVVHGGRLEAYFRTFRRRILPLVHRPPVVAALLAAKDGSARERFYEGTWDTWRWRLLFRLFFSRPVMGRLGRDPELFRYVEGPVSERILARTREAFTALPGEDNPYLHYVLTGGFGPALPDYLRPEHYPPIRDGLDRLHPRRGSVEDVLDGLPPRSIDAFNLSDVAEYMDVAAYHALLARLRRVAAPGARVAYWNLLAPRRRPPSMAHWLDAREEEALRLHREARAFFYQAFVLEVVR